eukprot:GSChrysophyteH1.ASY1.ANO1.126.1 assembled CDS
MQDLEGASIAPLPSFASRALKEAVKDPSWLPLCDKMHSEVRRQLGEMNVGKRFCELGERMQVALVEKNWKNIQQDEKRDLLDSFAARMSREIDEELLKYAEAERTGSDGSDPTNVEMLTREFTLAAIDMLENSPVNLMNTTKLFINRSLPGTIRPYIWTRALWLGKKANSSMNFARLAPSLDVILSRRCHGLLDNKFPRLSSRANASYAKTIVANFMRMVNLKIPTNMYDSFVELDHCAYLCIPLIVVMRSNFDHAKGASSSAVPNEDVLEETDIRFSDAHNANLKIYKGTSSSRFAVENCMYALTEPLKLGTLRVSSGNLSFAERAPGIGRAITLLSNKNSDLYSRLWLLQDQDDKRRLEGDFSTEQKSFDGFFNECLIRGLSGLLNLETCMFVWDQGFITDFGGILPMVLVALVLGDAEELRSLTSFKSAIDVFTSYCYRVTVDELQHLLSVHFPVELANFFDICGNYRFQRGNDGILQAMYKRIEESVGEVA